MFFNTVFIGLPAILIGVSDQMYTNEEIERYFIQKHVNFILSDSQPSATFGKALHLPNVSLKS